MTPRASSSSANLARDAELYAHSARRHGSAEQSDPSLHDELAPDRATLLTKPPTRVLARAS